MDTSIIVTIISSGVTLIGIIVGFVVSKNQMEQTLVTNQAVTDTKLEHLTEEVRRHNNFAQRVPVIEEQIKVINHRIDDLEKGA